MIDDGEWRDDERERERSERLASEFLICVRFQWVSFRKA